MTITEYPVFNLYAQTIALDTLTTDAGQQTFSEHQTIAGASVIYPLTRVAAIRGLRPSLIGAVNGRFLNIESATPGLSAQPTFAQFEEGLRLKPSRVRRPAALELSRRFPAVCHVRGFACVLPSMDAST